MKEKIMMFIIRYLFKRLKTHHEKNNKIPVGLPYMRDPDHPCEFYEPVKQKIEGFSAECYSDGHYLCKECKHYKPEHESNP